MPNTGMCPKCGKGVMGENEDGDWECVICGKVVYKTVAVGKKVSRDGYRRENGDKSENQKTIL